MKEEERLQIAREVYASMPEDMKDKLIEAAEVACREAGQEATPERVAGAIAGVMAMFADNVDAIFNEITEEERDRLYSEEFERLNTG
jgi:GTP cyclohydrolase I